MSTLNLVGGTGHSIHRRSHIPENTGFTDPSKKQHFVQIPLVPNVQLPDALQPPQGTEYEKSRSLIKEATKNGKDTKSLDIDKLALAISHLNRALEAKPENFYVLGNLGYVHFLLGKYADSISYYKRATVQAPNHPLCQVFYNDMGTACQKTKDIQGALYYYGQAVEVTDALPLAQKTSFAYKNRALIHKKLGLYPDALKDIRCALEIEERNGRTWAPFYQKVKNEILKRLPRHASCF